jgi:CRISPR/Cas system-associated protein Cas10 (large subunit of type III CRISPR-Cas system)
MDRVIEELSTDVMNNLTTDAQKEIVDDIIYNMNKYQADNTHDYESAAEAAYEKYKKLSVDERTELKYEIQIRNATKDLLILEKFFFPDVDL